MMMTSWTRKTIVAALALAGTLLLSVAGCGGQGPQSEQAVVVPPPDEVNVARTGTSTAPGSTAPSATSATAPTTSSPSAPAENVKAEGWGTLKGQITFNSNPPETKVEVEKGKASKDPNVCASESPIVSERLVVDPATKGVKNVLIFVRRPSAVKEEAKQAASKAEIEFDQVKCVFKPHVLVVMNGAKIVMKNSDPVPHNINSKLKNNGTNPSLAAGTATPFPTQGPENTPGQVECNIHPWMKAWWMVTDNPYFAVTDDKGNFEIKDVPAGTQKIVVWQESVVGGFITPAAGQSVNIKAGDTTPLDLKIEPGKVR